MLVVKGDGRADAELWFEAKNTGRKGYQRAREVWYYPKTGKIDVHDIGGGVIELGSSPERPTRQR